LRSAPDRRNEILNVINIRRSDSVPNLAFEFGVSERTIRRDVALLSEKHRIYCQHGGKGGGVHFEDEYYLKRNTKQLKGGLTDKHIELLNRLSIGLSAEDSEIMYEIFILFSVPKKGN